MDSLNLALVLTVIVLIEAVVQTVKPIYDKEKGWNVDVLLSLGISVVICVLVQIDIFKMVGAPLMVPYVGSVLTGIIGSRGSGVIHDIWTKISLIAAGNVPPVSPGMGAGTINFTSPRIQTVNNTTIAPVVDTAAAVSQDGEKIEPEKK